MAVTVLELHRTHKLTDHEHDSRWSLAAAAVWRLACPRPPIAQAFETLGTRAAGMGGAFVGGGRRRLGGLLEPGRACRRIVLQPGARPQHRRGRPGRPTPARQPIGLAHRAVDARRSACPTTACATRVLLPAPCSSRRRDGRNVRAGDVRLDTLITHHTGVTLVQSIGHGIAVGATLKLVRGIAASAVQPDGDRDELARRRQRPGREGQQQVRRRPRRDGEPGTLKAGLTVRNLTEPSSRPPDGGPALKLERQARAGVAVVPLTGLARRGRPRPARRRRGRSASVRDSRSAPKARVASGLRPRRLPAEHRRRSRRGTAVQRRRQLRGRRGRCWSMPR